MSIEMRLEGPAAEVDAYVGWLANIMRLASDRELTIVDVQHRRPGHKIVNLEIR